MSSGDDTVVGKAHEIFTCNLPSQKAQGLARTSHVAIRLRRRCGVSRLINRPALEDPEVEGGGGGEEEGGGGGERGGEERKGGREREEGERGRRSVGGRGGESLPPRRRPVQIVSAVEAIEQPARSDDIGADLACPLGEPTIGCHERHGMGAARGERGKRVVTLTRRVDHLDTAARVLGRASAGLTLEDDDNRLGQHSGSRRVADALYERPSRAGAVRHHPVGREPTTLAASISSIDDILASASPGIASRGSRPGALRACSESGS